MKNKKIAVTGVIILLMFALLYSIIQKNVLENKSVQSGANSNLFSALSQLTSEIVLENSEIADEISLSDVVIDRIYHGSFSPKNASELFILCKIMNVPHAGGLDRTAGIVLSADTLELIAYKEFAADKVEISCLQNSDGINRILFIGTTTYQGISAQEISLLAVEGSQWRDIPISALEDREKEYFYFMADNQILVATEPVLTPSALKAVLVWNPDSEEFSDSRQ